MIPFACPDELHTEIGLCVEALRSIDAPPDESPAVLAAVVPCLLSRVEQRLERLRLGTHDDWPYLERELLDDLDFLLENLDTPRLLAICDAYAEHGTCDERRNATSISLLVNWERLALTCDPEGESTDPMRVSRPLWDGMTSIVPSTSDAVTRLFRRLNGQLIDTPSLHRIFLRLIERMIGHDRSLIRRADSACDGRLLPSLVAALGSAPSLGPRPDSTPPVAEPLETASTSAPVETPPASEASELAPGEFQRLTLQALQGTTGGLSALFERQQEDRAHAEMGFGMLNAAFAKLATGLEEFVERRFAQACWADEIRHRDTLELIDRIRPIAGAVHVKLRTDHPLAEDTVDHLHPHGTARDNTRAPWFVAKCEEVFGRHIAALDLGCAGGGQVFDFTLRGHRAVGLEGSDYSARRLRAEWRTLRDRLFTCDVTRPFDLVDSRDGTPVRFDVVTAWDVMEHFPEDRLDQVFENVRRHLSGRGMFIGSVSTVPSIKAPDGSSYHATVQPRCWWAETFRKHGFELLERSPFQSTDFARGNNASPAYAIDFYSRPDLGFHFVATRIHS